MGSMPRTWWASGHNTRAHDCCYSLSRTRATDALLMHAHWLGLYGKGHRACHMLVGQQRVPRLSHATQRLLHHAGAACHAMGQPSLTLSCSQTSLRCKRDPSVSWLVVRQVST